MVNKKVKIYLIENDHRLMKYCEEKNLSPNSIPLNNFIEIANDIGWVMSTEDYEKHHNTRTLPQFYYIKIIGDKDAGAEGII